ncbi:MAG: nucleoside deaminase [Caldilineaceae bacterium]
MGHLLVEDGAGHKRHNHEGEQRQFPVDHAISPSRAEQRHHGDRHVFGAVVGHFADGVQIRGDAPASDRSCCCRRSGTRVLDVVENTVNTAGDCTCHAETNLVRAAVLRFFPGALRQCTLYTSTEPCAMCAGAIHWSGIGRVVYALSEADLYQLTGAHPENETMHLPCREVFARCDRIIDVDGPALEAEAATVHTGFWT